MTTGTPKPNDEGRDQTQLAVGSRVRHRHWGLGSVVALIGEGERAEAVVKFDEHGRKRLLLAWTSLDIVSWQECLMETGRCDWCGGPLSKGWASGFRPDGSGVICIACLASGPDLDSRRALYR